MFTLRTNIRCEPSPEIYRIGVEPVVDEGSKILDPESNSLPYDPETGSFPFAPAE